MNENITDMTSPVLEIETIKGYYIIIPGSPVTHYIFIAMHIPTRSTYICGEFDLYLN